MADHDIEPCMLCGAKHGIVVVDAPIVLRLWIELHPEDADRKALYFCSARCVYAHGDATARAWLARKPLDPA